MVSPFLHRALRRNMHAQQEGQIFKALSFGQNLEVGHTRVKWIPLLEAQDVTPQISDRIWPVYQSRGAVVEGAAGTVSANPEGTREETASHAEGEASPGALSDGGTSGLFSSQSSSVGKLNVSSESISDHHDIL